VGLGTYSREQARSVRAAAKRYGVEPLITEDHLVVEDQIAALQPELVLGTQMERHIAKRFGLPCTIISAPVHVHDYPARYSPQMGFEGANVLFDTWVHPLMMGLEEHLLGMFREDFEFADGVGPSHLGAHGHTRQEGDPTPDAASSARQQVEPVAEQADSPRAVAEQADSPRAVAEQADSPRAVAGRAAAASAEHVPAAPSRTLADAAPSADPRWTAEAEKELKKIPFFVRGKARRNTERFAKEQGRPDITLDTLYDAKAHFQA
jgi:light-independent protochlorophyllide reductase subunit B